MTQHRDNFKKGILVDIINREIGKKSSIRTSTIFSQSLSPFISKSKYSRELALSIIMAAPTPRPNFPNPPAKRFRFGPQTLDLFPTSAASFKILDHHKPSITDEQRCLLDNLWRSKEQISYFTATLNCLAEYFIANSPKKIFYLVYKGRIPGVYKHWGDVVSQIEGVKNKIKELFL